MMEDTEIQPDVSHDDDKIYVRKVLEKDSTNLISKISRESAKVLKLRVKQDAANWELKEQVTQLEQVRERQQQNLVDLQMQLEQLSSEHSNERRLREDVYNKVESTRSICNILEDYYGRLARALSKLEGDRRMLAENFSKAVDAIKEYESKHTAMTEKIKSEKNRFSEYESQMQGTQGALIRSIDAIKSMYEQQEKLSNNRIVALENQMKSIEQELNETKRKNLLLEEETSKYIQIIEEKTSEVARLNGQLTRLHEESNKHSMETVAIVMKQEEDKTSLIRELESMRNALTHQEAFGATLTDKMQQFQEQVYSLEDQLKAVRQEYSCLQNETQRVQQEYEQQLIRIQGENNKFRAELEEKNNRVNELEKELAETKEALAETEEQGRQALLKVEEENQLLISINTSKLEEIAHGKTNLREARTELAAVQANIKDLRDEYNNYKSATDARTKDLEKQLDRVEAERAQLAEGGAVLRAELAACTDARAKLEAAADMQRSQLNATHTQLHEKSKALADLTKCLEEVKVENASYKEKLNQMMDLLKSKNDNPAPKETKPAVQESGFNTTESSFQERAAPGAPDRAGGVGARGGARVDGRGRQLDPRTRPPVPSIYDELDFMSDSSADIPYFNFRRYEPPAPAPATQPHGQMKPAMGKKRKGDLDASPHRPPFSSVLSNQEANAQPTRDTGANNKIFKSKQKSTKNK